MTIKNMRKVFRYVGEREYTNKAGQKSMKHWFVDAEKDSDNREMMISINGFEGVQNGLYLITFDYREYRDRQTYEWKNYLKATGYSEYKK